MFLVALVAGLAAFNCLFVPLALERSILQHPRTPQKPPPGALSNWLVGPHHGNKEEAVEEESAAPDLPLTGEAVLVVMWLKGVRYAGCMISMLVLDWRVGAHRGNNAGTPRGGAKVTGEEAAGPELPITGDIIVFVGPELLCCLPSHGVLTGLRVSDGSSQLACCRIVCQEGVTRIPQVGW